MRNSISHPKNDFEGIHSHIPTKLLCLSPEKKKKCTREIALLSGGSSYERAQIGQGHFGAKNATPTAKGQGEYYQTHATIEVRHLFSEVP